MTGQLIQPREKVLNYIQAHLIGGLTKGDAYREYIDGNVKNVHQAIARMEKKQEYKDIFMVVTSDENYKFQVKAQKVRGKYLNMVDRTLSTMDEIFDQATKSDDAAVKGAAVRLANETTQALAVVSGGAPENAPNAPRLDKASVVS